MKHWLSLLEEDWKRLNDSDFKIEDLYDPETGLPARRSMSRSSLAATAYDRHGKGRPPLRSTSVTP